jgi:hypothetical protein
MPILPQPPPARVQDHALYVICMVSNPRMFASRYALYSAFKARMLKDYPDALTSKASPTVQLYTAEIAFADRAFEVTQAGDPRALQLRTNDEIWHKENALNLLTARLPSDWKYVAWVDADVTFNDPQWAEKTVHALQSYRVVQPWSDALDMGPQGQVVQHHVSFARQVVEHGPTIVAAVGTGSGYYAPVTRNMGVNTVAAKAGTTLPQEYPHCGFAWACRREVWDGLGGLPDWCIMGSGDHHLAHAMIENVMRSYPGRVSDAYVKRLTVLQDRCTKAVDMNIGYVPGTILHAFHGRKADRKYNERWKILQDNHFDPDVDIMRDAQGLYRLAGNKRQLRDQMSAYFAARNEDASEL